MFLIDTNVWLELLLDADFDVTDRGRKTPMEALNFNQNHSAT